ncbi:MAG: YdiU family protein [Afipia sp.]|nr:YdiU family protein [Afipia sp.]
MPVSSRYRPSSSHAALGPDFHDVVAAATFPGHILRYRNQRAATTVGLDTLTDAEWIAHFGQFEPLAGTFGQPLALRYHGHQFRSYNPDLGDGRGFLFAQLYDDRGRLLDLATKGSGRTPWSRTADGRLTLKGGVREVLATSMLEALGVDTSKSFSLIETGESLIRGDEPSPTRSSVLVRLSHSHIRIGTFQRQAFHRRTDNIATLLDYTIKTYMPDVWRDEPAARALAFLEEVCRRVARVGAQWMAAGFVHGVLNTDNINITGESFDYGPWRFLPVLDPAFTAAYFDETGLYAYGRQPDALFWNLTRLAECLLGIADQASLEKTLGVFEPVLRREFTSAMLNRLGVESRGAVLDNELVRALWVFLSETKAPFEQTFFNWFGGLASAARAGRSPSQAFYAAEAFQPVREALTDYAPRNGIDLAHPFFARGEACAMLIEEVEAIWAPIAEWDDWSAFHAKLKDIDQMRAAYGLA